MTNLNDTELNAEAGASASKTARASKRAAKRNASSPSIKAKPKTKKEQLIVLLSKPSGVRVSLLVERLGWQAHTVRAALSGLRKRGFEISTSKSAKSGETVYAITGQPASADDVRTGVAE